MGQEWVGGDSVQLSGHDLMLAFKQKPRKNRPQGCREIKRKLTEDSHTLFCGKVTRSYTVLGNGYKRLRSHQEKEGVIRAVTSKRQVKGAVNAT